MPRRLAGDMRAYRIGDPQGRFPIWSPDGAMRVAGRWHEAGAEVIYASENYSTALLEVLAHWNGILPRGQQYIEITIPRGTSYEMVTEDAIPNWFGRSAEAARRFGRDWYAENRSAILIVPSVVARMEQNVVINSRHAEFTSLMVGPEKPVFWDERLLP
ncbi:MAG: RES domain-containing protein [Gammaproteobacteria bacterium]|nr:RES domain-containing protein [Gammaproteobacteria bacterium]